MVFSGVVNWLIWPLHESRRSFASMFQILENLEKISEKWQYYISLK